ncbi:MAG: OmpA family protein, partial [Saprospiraceae bacterium]
EVEKYLSDVAKRVIKSGERVKLTGHTDNVDSDSFNHKLGMRRANIVKKYLLNKGVKANKIIAQSKGEKAPIATNSNSKGRAQNRRTELQIIK